MGCHALQGIFPTQELNPISGISCIAGRFFTYGATWEAKHTLPQHVNCRPNRKRAPCLASLIGGGRKNFSTPGNKPASKRPPTCQSLSFHQWTLCLHGPFLIIPSPLLKNCLFFVLQTCLWFAIDCMFQIATLGCFRINPFCWSLLLL